MHAQIRNEALFCGHESKFNIFGLDGMQYADHRIKRFDLCYTKNSVKFGVGMFLIIWCWSYCLNNRHYDS